MLPLAPLEQARTRALTTIYAPRKPRTRKNKTAQSRNMLDNEVPIKNSLSPFYPLPAIGQTRTQQQAQLILYDLNQNDTFQAPDERPIKIKNLTPVKSYGYSRKGSLDSVEEKKPQSLLRENTYDVFDPVYVTAPQTKKRDEYLSKRSITMIVNSENKQFEKADTEQKDSPKTRFKKAAMKVVKLSSLPETGKLLCLREKETLRLCCDEDDKSSCKLQNLPECPTQNLTKLSEIFQCLETRNRHRDRMKKENMWF